MKLKELFYVAGIRPKPQSYPFEVKQYELATDGVVEYAQWMHPRETIKPVRQEAVDELRKYLSPGDVAIDIGAHTGDTTLPMALAVGPTGAVLALEPNSYVFPVLEENARLNADRTNIVPLPFAATDEPGEFEFAYSDSGFCNGGDHHGISKWRHGHAFLLKVQGRNLVQHIRSEMPDLWSRVRFVKVDAEGADHAVLQSIEELLRDVRPYVRSEVFKHTSRSQRESYIQFLQGLGYRVYRFAGDGEYRGEEVTLDTVMDVPHFDIFCVPNQR